MSDAENQLLQLLGSLQESMLTLQRAKERSTDLSAKAAPGFKHGLLDEAAVDELNAASQVVDSYQAALKVEHSARRSVLLQLKAILSEQEDEKSVNDEQMRTCAAQQRKLQKRISMLDGTPSVRGTQGEHPHLSSSYERISTFGSIEDALVPVGDASRHLRQLTAGPPPMGALINSHAESKPALKEEYTYCTGSEKEIYNNSFRNNIQEFLKVYGKRISLPGLKKVNAWIIPLTSPEDSVFLHVYEEKLSEASNTVCDQCRCMGWQHHPVCNRKYHFIVPNPLYLHDMSHVTAVVEARLKGKGKELKFTWNGPEDDDQVPFTAPSTCFDSKAHLLHGVVHINGYGHLMRMNGREGGSLKLHGKHLMTIWDNMCTVLRVREVSTEDVSNKSDMLLRVLHTAAFQRTWYGKWGYEFGRGGFNLKKADWWAAVTYVSEAPIEAIQQDYDGVDKNIGLILHRYSQLGGTPAFTLGGVLRKMLKILSAAAAAMPPPAAPKALPPAAPPVTAKAGDSNKSDPVPLPPRREPPVYAPPPPKKKPSSSSAKSAAPTPMQDKYPMDSLPKQDKLSLFEIGSLYRSVRKSDTSKSKVDRVVTLTLEALQTMGQDNWVSRQTLRTVVYKQFSDGAIVDAVLKAIGNTFVKFEGGEYKVFRSLGPQKRSNFYLIEVEGAPRPLPASTAAEGEEEEYATQEPMLPSPTAEGGAPDVPSTPTIDGTSPRDEPTLMVEDPESGSSEPAPSAQFSAHHLLQTSMRTESAQSAQHDGVTAAGQVGFGRTPAGWLQGHFPAAAASGAVPPPATLAPVPRLELPHAGGAALPPGQSQEAHLLSQAESAVHALPHMTAHAAMSVPQAAAQPPAVHADHGGLSTAASNDAVMRMMMVSAASAGLPAMHTTTSQPSSLAPTDRATQQLVGVSSSTPAQPQQHITGPDTAPAKAQPSVEGHGVGLSVATSVAGQSPTGRADSAGRAAVQDEPTRNSSPSQRLHLATSGMTAADKAAGLPVMEQEGAVQPALSLAPAPHQAAAVGHKRARSGEDDQELAPAVKLEASETAPQLGNAPGSMDMAVQGRDLGASVNEPTEDSSAIAKYSASAVCSLPPRKRSKALLAAENQLTQESDTPRSRSLSNPSPGLLVNATTTSLPLSAADLDTQPTSLPADVCMNPGDPHNGPPTSISHVRNAQAHSSSQIEGDVYAGTSHAWASGHLGETGGHQSAPASAALQDFSYATGASDGELTQTGYPQTGGAGNVGGIGVKMEQGLSDGHEAAVDHRVKTEPGGTTGHNDAAQQGGVQRCSSEGQAGTQQGGGPAPLPAQVHQAVPSSVQAADQLTAPHTSAPATASSSDHLPPPAPLVIGQNMELPSSSTNTHISSAPTDQPRRHFGDHGNQNTANDNAPHPSAQLLPQSVSHASLQQSVSIPTSQRISHPGSNASLSLSQISHSVASMPNVPQQLHVLGSHGNQQQAYPHASGSPPCSSPSTQAALSALFSLANAASAMPISPPACNGGDGSMVPPTVPSMPSLSTSLSQPPCSHQLPKSGTWPGLTGLKKMNSITSNSTEQANGECVKLEGERDFFTLAPEQQLDARVMEASISMGPASSLPGELELPSLSLLAVNKSTPPTQQPGHIQQQPQLTAHPSAHEHSQSYHCNQQQNQQQQQPQHAHLPHAEVQQHQHQVPPGHVQQQEPQRTQPNHAPGQQPQHTQLPQQSHAHQQQQLQHTPPAHTHAQQHQSYAASMSQGHTQGPESEPTPDQQTQQSTTQAPVQHPPQHSSQGQWSNTPHEHTNVQHSQPTPMQQDPPFRSESLPNALSQHQPTAAQNIRPVGQQHPLYHLQSQPALSNPQSHATYQPSMHQHLPHQVQSQQHATVQQAVQSPVQQHLQVHSQPSAAHPPQHIATLPAVQPQLEQHPAQSHPHPPAHITAQHAASYQLQMPLHQTQDHTTTLQHTQQPAHLSYQLPSQQQPSSSQQVPPPSQQFQAQHLPQLQPQTNAAAAHLVTQPSAYLSHQAQSQPVSQQPSQYTSLPAHITHHTQSQPSPHSAQELTSSQHATHPPLQQQQPHFIGSQPPPSLPQQSPNTHRDTQLFLQPPPLHHLPSQPPPPAHQQQFSTQQHPPQHMQSLQVPHQLQAGATWLSAPPLQQPTPPHLHQPGATIQGSNLPTTAIDPSLPNGVFHQVKAESSPAVPPTHVSSAMLPASSLPSQPQASAISPAAKAEDVPSIPPAHVLKDLQYLYRKLLTPHPKHPSNNARDPPGHPDDPYTHVSKRQRQTPRANSSYNSLSSDPNGWPSKANVSNYSSSTSGAFKGLCLPHFSAMIQTLKDAKHYVKDYKGEFMGEVDGQKGLIQAVAGVKSGAADASPAGLLTAGGERGSSPEPGMNGVREDTKVIRLLVQAEMRVPQKLSTTSFRQPPKPSFTLTPTELLLVTERTTLGDLKRQVFEAFSSMYRTFRDFNVDAIKGVDVKNDRDRLGPLPDYTLLTAITSGYDNDPRWQHAGGVEDWVVSCTCGTVDDDGERMICCDKCEVWMHTRCSGIPDDCPEPASFVCPDCAADVEEEMRRGGYSKGRSGKPRHRIPSSPE